MEKGIGQTRGKGCVRPRLAQTLPQPGRICKLGAQTPDSFHIPHPQTPQSAPRRFDTPARRVTVQHNPQDSTRRQTRGQGLETGQGISKMVQHPIRIDQPKRAWGNDRVIKITCL